jgi:hypothetical protein
MSAHYWVKVEGSGYFVRFGKHHPTAEWYTSHRHETAYCFPSIDDAQHVVDLLRRYQRSAVIFGERQERDEHPPQPDLIQPPPLPSPPTHLREWVDRILVAASATDRTLSTLRRVKRGYRGLARQCHPDVGGTKLDMQRLGAANAWLQKHRAVAECRFRGGQPFGDNDRASDDIPL